MEQEDTPKVGDAHLQLGSEEWLIRQYLFKKANNIFCDTGSNPKPSQPQQMELALSKSEELVMSYNFKLQFKSP